MAHIHTCKQDTHIKILIQKVARVCMGFLTPKGDKFTGGKGASTLHASW